MANTSGGRKPNKTSPLPYHQKLFGAVYPVTLLGPDFQYRLTTPHDTTVGEKYWAFLPYLRCICMDPVSREGGSVNVIGNIIKNYISKGDTNEEIF